MNKRSKSFLLSILTFSFIFYSCSNLANDLQKRKNQNLFNITIQETSNGTVTVAKSSGIKAGEEVILTVTATSGYELKTISVTNTQNKDVAVAAMEQGTSYKFTMPDSDVTVCTTFDKTGPVDITEPGDLSGANGNTVYRIEHYQQDLDDTNSYTLYAIQKKKGNVGADTAASAKDYPGFTSLSFTQKKIAPDGSTVVEIYYNRKTITYTFELHGGNWEGSEGTVVVSGLYGATVNKPSRIGYHLSENISELFGPEDVLYSVYWVVNRDTPYKVKVYLQNVEGGDNYTLQTEITKTGETDNYTHYDDSIAGFNLERVNQKLINGDGSTELNAYYDRISYTVHFDTNGGNILQDEPVLYQASPKSIPYKEGYKLWYWYEDGEIYNSTEGITKETTLQASWVTNTTNYKLHEKIERLPKGTDGTFGTDGEYVLFGDYPQTRIVSDDITLDMTLRIYTIKHHIGSPGMKFTVYSGNDEYLYIQTGANIFYRIEPIKWRVIYRNDFGNAVLLAENILMLQQWNGENDDHSYSYDDSRLSDSLNSLPSYDYTSFLFDSFTKNARTLLRNDSYYGSIVHIFSPGNVFDLQKFPSIQNRIRIPTDFALFETKKFQQYDIQCYSNYWWLCSIVNDSGVKRINVVTDQGEEFIVYENNCCGVVPAITVYLPEEE